MQKSASAQEIEREVISAFWRHKRRYGTRRLVAELSDKDLVVGRKKVRSIMSNYELRAIQPSRYVPRTTQSHPHLKRSPNLLLDRGLATRPNEIWVGDITFLPLDQGDWCYLAIWLDTFSHTIVGWKVAEHMREELVIEAFKQGLRKRNPPKGLIVHSDGGGQYAGKRFRKLLKQKELMQSMTRKENHYDNATAESLFSRFKTEVLEGGKFLNIEDAMKECFEYIEAYYNTIRKHSSIGYKSPHQFERELGY